MGEVYTELISLDIRPSGIQLTFASFIKNLRFRNGTGERKPIGESHGDYIKSLKEM